MMTPTVQLQPRQAPRHGGRSARREQRAIDAALAADRAARSGWVRRAARPESWRVLRDGTVQFKMRQWHGTWRWLVHADSGSETEGMTTEVADEHSVYIENLGGRYIWDEARSCWKWTMYVARARPSSLLRARLTPSRHTSRFAHGLRCSGSAGCAGGPALNVCQ